MCKVSNDGLVGSYTVQYIGGFLISFWRRVLPPLSGLLSAQRSSFEQHLLWKPVKLYLNSIITNRHKIHVYMYIWNYKRCTFAIRHKIYIVNRKTVKAACVSVTAQNKNFFFVLSSAVTKYCGLLCFTFCMQSGTWNSGCGLRLFQVQ